RDAGELLDLTAERLLVQALDVAACTLVDRRLDVDLDELAVLLDQLTSMPARFLVRRDRADEHRGAMAGQSRGDPADSLDVRVPVLLRETEPLREVRPDDIAVQVLDLVGDGPAAGALLLVGRGRPGTGDAADRAIAGLVQRVVRNLVDLDVGPDALLVPVDERVDLPDAVAVRPLQLRRRRAAGRLVTSDAGD